ncbi:LysR family transcriptional regulator [Sporosarcina sp. G11-34]|uniref:LysR family transcriptional regulator n=1 Tax=Sporosarcina sp. G11-34 TaxID=2849605 RepID=UPI0022A97ABF|nr:LysR family transcriptional regulator [Sporosarcina sp. G11-34]MCZ2256930.1 LysR family transcriptional regulator [Sporosarcina sp. G11-34]
MELRHLRYFIAVAEELHFGRAAERLQISQPPLSLQIKQLETNLGVSLFSRTRQRVELTSAGESFLKNSYKIIRFIEKACEESKSVGRGESGQLILAFTGAIGFELLPTILRAYHDKYPDVNIILKQMTTSDQIVSFRNNEIDVGLIVLPVLSESLNIELLHEEPYIVALPREHHLAQDRETINIASLVNEEFIMTSRDSGQGYYDSIISLCNSAGFSPTKTQEADELHNVVSFVASGMGIAILPSSIQFFKNDDIVYLPLENNTSSYRTGIAWNKTEDSPTTLNFISFLNEIIIPKTLSENISLIGN